MAQIGNAGVDLLLSDSTNSLIPGSTPSEYFVRKQIFNVVYLPTRLTLNEYHWETLKMNSTKIFALGGLNEIGKNTYCFEEGNEIIIVDAGVKFPDEELVSVRLINLPFDTEEKNQTCNLPLKQWSHF